MNKFVASVGLVALGAASVQAQSSISSPPPKWWNISATVRGFYDDNANTAPENSGIPQIGTWGYDLNPSVGINLGDQQTTFSATYTYNFIYYEKRLTGTIINPVTGQSTSTQKYDQDHTFSALLDHAFNERYSIHVGDSFVIGQQPDMLRAGTAINAFYRVSGNNVVNAGTITVHGELTPVLGFEAGYNNGLYDYDAEQLAGPLNRIENYAHLDARWTMAPETVGVLGYQFGYVDYTGSGPDSLIVTEPTLGNLTTNNISIRNTLSHTFYVGADHTFLPELTGSIRAGASYYDYYNDPNGVSDWGPYAQGSLTYAYAPQSTVTLGFQESRQSSSLVGIQNTTSVIHDTETSVIYGTIVHRIAPRLFGEVIGTFQNSIYHGGGPGIDGQSDRFYEVGVQFNYKFNPNFSVQAGYDYDRLDSGLNPVLVGFRKYDRNKFYIGATASY